MLQTFSPNVTLSTRIACVYWQFGDSSHAAEITAGYLNYTNIVQMLNTYGVQLEMECFDLSTKSERQDTGSNTADPQGLVSTVMQAAAAVGVQMEGTNSLITLTNFNGIVSTCKQDPTTISSFNVRYLTSSLITNNVAFSDFIGNMKKI